MCVFCKRALEKRQYYAKETYNCIDPTDSRHHTIAMCVHDVHIFLNNTRHRVVCCDTSHVPATIATHSLFYRALLQKRPIILRSQPLSPRVCTSSISFWTTCMSFCEIEYDLTDSTTIRSHLWKLHLHLQQTYTFDTCVHVMHVVLWNRICFHR